MLSCCADIHIFFTAPVLTLCLFLLKYLKMYYVDFNVCHVKYDSSTPITLPKTLGSVLKLLEEVRGSKIEEVVLFFQVHSSMLYFTCPKGIIGTVLSLYTEFAGVNFT